MSAEYYAPGSEVVYPSLPGKERGSSRVRPSHDRARDDLHRVPYIWDTAARNSQMPDRMVQYSTLLVIDLSRSCTRYVASTVFGTHSAKTNSPPLPRRTRPPSLPIHLMLYVQYRKSVIHTLC